MEHRACATCRKTSWVVRPGTGQLLASVTRWICDSCNKVHAYDEAHLVAARDARLESAVAQSSAATAPLLAQPSASRPAALTQRREPRWWQRSSVGTIIFVLAPFAALIVIGLTVSWIFPPCG